MGVEMDWARHAVVCRGLVRHHMRHGCPDATKFWVRELVRALRHRHHREIC